MFCMQSTAGKRTLQGYAVDEAKVIKHFRSAGFNPGSAILEKNARNNYALVIKYKL